MFRRKRLYLRRRFLNDRGYHTDATAFVKATKITRLNSAGEVISVRVNAEARLRDCENGINLEFSFDNQEHQHNAVFKARLLSDIFAGLADALSQVDITNPKAEVSEYDD